MKKVSVVIPAYNEAQFIVPTLQAVSQNVPCDEIIVVDDGSEDDTADLAFSWADRVIRLPRNMGKGYALQAGWGQAKGEILLLLDSDLRESAREAKRLIEPVHAEECEMAIAVLPTPPRKAGMGLVKGLAHRGIKRLTGFSAAAPLSGQRAVTREVVEQLGKLDYGFGIEVGLTVGALRAGYRVLEVPLPFTHRVTGNNWAGYMHRGKEFVAVGRALHNKWREK